MNTRGCSKRTDQKLDTFDWLCDIPESSSATDLVEVTFKNTRKGYYRNTNELALEKGDIVAVESSPGHDIGTVSMTGQLVLAQMKKYHVDQSRTEIKRIYRKVRPNDMERYEEAKAREHETMLRARKIAEDLRLNMKIGDVEYQGDGNKAIFYYIADERVDFRELIKVLADAFHVRIEMKQIGARQEAGRIGGIGPCGRALCCSSWMTKFSSVATSSARYQEISLNPQKLAGQCAKLKCCLNFEIDAYVEAQKQLPDRNIPLETLDATFYHFKTDVFSGVMQYSSSPKMAANIVSIPVERVREIIALNSQGIKVDSLLESSGEEKHVIDYENVVGQDSLTRFDKKKKKKKDKSGKGNANVANANQQENEENRENDSNNLPAEGTAERQDNNRRNNNNRNRRNNNRDRRQGNMNNSYQEGRGGLPQQGGDMPQNERWENRNNRQNDGRQNDNRQNDGRNFNRNNPNMQRGEGGGRNDGRGGRNNRRPNGGRNNRRPENGQQMNNNQSNRPQENE